MSNDYIPHGQDCDFGLMLISGGEYHANQSDYDFMERLAKREKTHLVEVIDCEGAVFCIAPLPIARWIIRVMNKEFDRVSSRNIEENNKEFKPDWDNSGCPDERLTYGH